LARRSATSKSACFISGNRGEWASNIYIHLGAATTIAEYPPFYPIFLVLPTAPPLASGKEPASGEKVSRVSLRRRRIPRRHRISRAEAIVAGMEQDSLSDNALSSHGIHSTLTQIDDSFPVGAIASFLI
jgi:hypothetical protein